MTETVPTFDLVVAANRLPVDFVVNAQGGGAWQRSPGGLVSAMEGAMAERDAAWVGWSGEPGVAPEPFREGALFISPVPLSPVEVEEYYEGFSNDTLWPVYHDVIVQASFHRQWWNTYQVINRRFAQAVAEVAAEGATVWVHDYQLQLVPAMLRELRPDVRIGWFDHIPFPPVELFAQLPWRGALLEGLVGADFLGFQRVADAENFLRSCRRLLGLSTRGDIVAFTPRGGGPERRVRASAIPISVDFRGLSALAATPEVLARAAEIRASLGSPEILMLGVDRLDYTKGIRHRLKAYGELLQEGALAPPKVTLTQVAMPTRERVNAYRVLREEVERTVGQINGEYEVLGSTPIHYLRHSYPREEMAALYVAADVMLVTPLRDGMNLVAKEYVSCRNDLGGALVLSEFAGAWHELHQAFICNPHDIEGLKQTIMSAINAPAEQRRRRMKAMRKRVADHDVQRWASRYLDALATAPSRPQGPARATDEKGRSAAPASPRTLSDHGSQRIGRYDVNHQLRTALSVFAVRPRVLVAVDFDGTLAPLVTDPLRARAVAGGLEALQDAASLTGVTAAIVSGRDLATLETLTSIGADQHIQLIGSHGAEARSLGPSDVRSPTPAPVDRETVSLLNAVSSELEALRSRHPAARLEYKPAAVVLHTRGMQPSEAQAASKAARDVGARHEGVHVLPGKEVVELSISPADKGTAVKNLAVWSCSDATLYVGDDATDERAFAALNPASGDVTIKVGSGETSAVHRIPDPEAVVEMLNFFINERRQKK